MEEEPDDIAKWAESLTPEGSPGTMAQLMRAHWGDANYDNFISTQERLSKMHIDRQSTINGLLALTFVWLMALSVFTTIGAGVFLFRYIF